MVVGHELTHGFDDEGSQFDAKGNLASWWTPTASDKFKAKISCVERQYSAYEALPGLRVNGALTLGENIADNGGAEARIRGLPRTPQQRERDGSGRRHERRSAVLLGLCPELVLGLSPGFRAHDRTNQPALPATLSACAAHSPTCRNSAKRSRAKSAQPCVPRTPVRFGDHFTPGRARAWLMVTKYVA